MYAIQGCIYNINLGANSSDLLIPNGLISTLPTFVIVISKFFFQIFHRLFFLPISAFFHFRRLLSINSTLSYISSSFNSLFFVFYSFFSGIFFFRFFSFFSSFIFLHSSFFCFSIILII